MSYPHLILRSLNHSNNIAIEDESGTYTYKQLLTDSQQLAATILKQNPKIQRQTISFLFTAGYKYVVCQWAIWQVGAIAVPLCTKHPYSEIQYVLEDSQSKCLLFEDQFAELLNPALLNFKEQAINVSRESTWKTNNLELFDKPVVTEDHSSQILYTSGTTGKPKGVLHTHKQLEAQITTLVKAWEWSSDDSILHILPLHHTHGIINKLLCALWSGAKVVFLKQFNAEQVWNSFKSQSLSLFMAVPSIYRRLIDHFEKCNEEEQIKLKGSCKQFRLMVSGSAALPISTLKKWETISGHILLERYGMTEIGMALSNSYQDTRIPGAVGKPLPGIQTMVVDENGNEVKEGQKGELLIKGPSVFKEYWNKPKATKEAFNLAWFKTGDIVQVEEKIFRIVGRNSVDIIKTGGYKVSALEIEEQLRQHPNIAQVAVVGILDEEWGERVAAGIVMKANNPELELAVLRNWCRDKLAPYKIPSKLLILDSLPSNVMGKITKVPLRKLFTSQAI